MSARIDNYALDRLATEGTRARLAPLTVADLDRPTGTTGWDIRGLLSHLVGGNIRFARALRGEPADWPSRDLEPVASPLAEFDSTAADLATTVAALDDPMRPTLLPAGEPPAVFAVGVHGADMLVHGWDLAVATGQDATLDPELCLAALRVVEKYPPSFWGPGRFFAPRVQTGSTDPQDRLLAFTGRDPRAHAGR
ncbi:TIGR03086 family metal-binding protein [Plantactinospora siamensis]|uniref:TIGR03086 family metal-binding protein n=1 Tax=Plantactinospora siamensis TaxID=555372 RepID=A0ABV6P4A8_9ACTN